MEIERGELQRNCLMSLLEITVVAAAKAAVHQLIRVIQESDDPSLQVATARSVGCLAHTFPTRETRVLGPLVVLLGHGDEGVAAEAVAALGKFACLDNFLCVQHYQTIIEFGSVPPLVRLLRSNGWVQLHGMVLACYLVIHAGKSDDLE